MRTHLHQRKHYRLRATAIVALLLAAPILGLVPTAGAEGEFQPDPNCTASPAYYTMVFNDHPTPSARTFPKTYRYVQGGVVSTNAASFYDGCNALTSDGAYELGKNGILLKQSSVVNVKVNLLPSWGGNLSFIIGADRDGSRIIGDTPVDCLQGPFTNGGITTCAADPDGNLVAFPLSVPQSTPVPGTYAGVRIWVCTGVISYNCGSGGGGNPNGGNGGWQNDANGDGMGDAWVKSAEQEGMKILGRLMDQETADAAHPNGGDGLSNIDEFRWTTWPLGPVQKTTCVAGVCTTVDVFPNARDFDMDGWEDGPEVRYWNDPSNDPTLDNTAWVALQSSPFDPDYTNGDFETPKDGLSTVRDPDNDNDGTLDGAEFYTWGTYPEFVDSDCTVGQACPSPAEVGNHTVAVKHPSKPGTGDGINDTAEIAAWNALGAGMWNIDYDLDGIRDNLRDPDSDGDGIKDGDEFRCVLPPCTNPSKADTDGDSLLDGNNLLIGSNDPRMQLFLQYNIAHEPASYGQVLFYGEKDAGTNALAWDTDNDKVPDGWEARYHLNALVPDGGLDQDGDGLSNLAEYQYLCPRTPTCGIPVWWSGTNPTKADTDADNLLDGDEINRGTKPLEPDTDLDGLTDGDEVLVHGTNPKEKDTDGDGLNDYQERITYVSSGVSATNPNTDRSWNNTNDDTLTDYQEIIQYSTEPNNWDTDNDGVADGRDKSPLHYDSPPQVTPLPPVNPLQQPHDAYVIFREDGYVDVMMEDAHGNEGDIDSVEVKVRFNGIVKGVSGKFAYVHQYAQRFDDGSTWGARVALPEDMSLSTDQVYSLVVTTTDGNTVQYKGTSPTDIKQVVWKADTDPAFPNDWRWLRVHESKPEAGPLQGGSGTESQFILPDPRRMAVDQIFAVYGNFSIYRLKPFAVAQADLPNVTNSAAFAVIHAAGDNNTAWNGTVFEDAFELVDPVLEPGLYASTADGGNGWFRTPRWLRTGMQVAWDATRSAVGFVTEEATAQGASFLFGSDDPRAKGRLAGDIVSGILVYGDVRDVVVGTFNDQPWKAVLGGVGIGLTWVGPEADGPYSAFKSGAKLIASVPTAGPRLVIRMAEDIGARAAALKSAGDVGLAIRFISNEGDLAIWASRNTDKVVDFERVKTALPADSVHALKDTIEPVTALSADLARVTSDTEGKAILTRFHGTAAADGILPAGGPEAVKDLSDVAKVVRDAASAAGRDPNTAGNLMKNIDTVRNAQNGKAWWESRLKPNLLSNTNGRWGYVFEPEIAASLAKKGQLGKVDGVLNDVRLWDANKQPVGDALTAQIDMFSVVNGKNVITEVKSGSGTAISATADLKTQMEKHAAAAARWRDVTDANVANEVHWYFEKPPTQGVKDWAVQMADKYGVAIKLKDPTGADYLTYV